jgi:hypothetical protein
VYLAGGHSTKVPDRSEQTSLPDTCWTEHGVVVPEEATPSELAKPVSAAWNSSRAAEHFGQFMHLYACVARDFFQPTLSWRLPHHHAHKGMYAGPTGISIRLGQSEQEASRVFVMCRSGPHKKACARTINSCIQRMAPRRPSAVGG